MLVIVFLGLLAVALSHGSSDSDRVFDAFDGNKDGIVRLGEVFTAYGNDDTNKDGLLTPEEFAAGVHPGSPPLPMEKSFNFFDKQDTKEDKIIDSFAPVVLFQGQDDNDDREITREEFERTYLLLFGGTEDGDSQVEA